MTKHNKFFGLIMAALAMVGAAFSVPAHAGDLVVLKNTEPAVLLYAVDDATPAYTNSTTSYTDVAGVSFSFPAINKPHLGDLIGGTKQFIEVCYNADVTKATSTTGSVAVFANGAVIAASERFVSSAAGRTTLHACYTVARATNTAQTVKLQARSGDTAAFTISNLQATARLLYIN